MPRQVTTKKRELWRAIRSMCLHCCGDSAAEVKECPSADCALWRFRLGAVALRPETELGTTISPKPAQGTAGGDRVSLGEIGAYRRDLPITGREPTA